MKLKRIAAWGLAITMTLSLDIPGVNAASGVIDTTLTPATADSGDEVLSKDDQIALAKGSEGTPGQIPGTTREFFTGGEDIREWFNVSGYAAAGVQDRSEYYEEYKANGSKNTKNYIVVEEDGYWNASKAYISKETYETLSSSQKSAYSKATAEAQFAYALSQKPKVIQVNAEKLELGWKYLEEIGVSSNDITKVTDKVDPITSPVLMEKGLSDVGLYSHLTIFSTTGCKIRHGGLDLGGCEDVIVRNFQFEGMYEWDEPTYKGSSYDSHKRFGWCNVSCNDSDNIWVDHCTFGFAFDGNLDAKNGSTVSVTWCKFGVQDLSTNGEENRNPLPKWNESEGSELWKNILYMEECYQEYVADHNKTDKYFPEYYSLRGKDAGNGATPKQIMEYAAFHSKVHLVGSGEGDFYTNVQEKITLAFNTYTSVIQRMPLVRSGNGHMYNCIVDNTELKKHTDAISANPNASMKEFYSGYVSVNNPRNGASIGTDTSIFKEVTPVSGAETQGYDLKNVNENWIKVVTPMVNHSLVVNSRVSMADKEDSYNKKEDGYYEGSSWDNNGENLFTTGDGKWTWVNKNSIGDWKWGKWEGLEKFLNTGAFDNNKISATILATFASNPTGLYNTYYKGQYELEYDYKCFNLDDVEDKLEEYGGAKANLYEAADEEEQDPLDYIQPYNDKTMSAYAKKVVLSTDGGTVTDKDDNTYYLKAGDTITLPTAEEITKYGYDFLGWKKGVYAGGKLVLDEEVLTDTTIKSEGNEFTEYYFAQWKKHIFSVKFVVINGTELETIKELPVEYERRINAEGGSPTPSPKEGATFLGWYEDYDPETQTFGAYIPDNTTVLKDMLLYAKWNNTITFETNGGTEIESRRVESGETIGSIADPTKEGVIFAGWYKDAEFTEPFDPKTDKVMDPMTLYAKWVEGLVTVSFETGMEGVTMDAIDVEVGATGSAILAVDPPKDSKGVRVFGGWYYDEKYENAFDPEAEITENITLYAKWKLLGDVDDNGLIEADDALVILKVKAGQTPEKYVEEAADVDNNGLIEADDALGILKLKAGNIKDFSELWVK